MVTIFREWCTSWSDFMFHLKAVPGLTLRKFRIWFWYSITTCCTSNRPGFGASSNGRWRGAATSISVGYVKRRSRERGWKTPFWWCPPGLSHHAESRWKVTTLSHRLVLIVALVIVNYIMGSISTYWYQN